MKIESRYLDGAYAQNNPDWDREDAPWKASLVMEMLNAHQIHPQTICEVGCGSGDVLQVLRNAYGNTEFFGYDISPQAAELWTNSPAVAGGEIQYTLGDFIEIDTAVYDVLLVLDVLEHVRDPFTFLESIKAHAGKFIFHIPLDLHASVILRETPLLYARHKTGHLHYYTKALALETLLDCGYKIVEWRYTGASLKCPNRSIKTRLAGIPRRMAFFLNKDWGVRLFGGETLLVLAE